jgi:TRAP-type C4-dicarboxylate transport system permease small subunit
VHHKARIQVAINRILILAAILAMIAGLLAAHWEVVLRYARLL